MHDATLTGPAVFQRRLHDWLELLPLLPIVLFLLLLFVYPVAQLLWLSVVDNQGSFTGAHYVRLFTTNTYVRVLGVTFEIALWTTLISVLAGYPLAYLIATTSSRVRNVLILCVLVPFWTSFLVRTFAWLVLLGRKGAINDWLITSGLIDAPLPLIYNRAGVLIGMVPRLDANRRADHGYSHAHYRSRAGRRGEHARSAGGSIVLARLLATVHARSRGGCLVGVRALTRLLHYSRPLG